MYKLNLLVVKTLYYISLTQACPKERIINVYISHVQYLHAFPTLYTTGCLWEQVSFMSTALRWWWWWSQLFLTLFLSCADGNEPKQHNQQQQLLLHLSAFSTGPCVLFKPSQLSQRTIPLAFGLFQRFELYFKQKL